MAENKTPRIRFEGFTEDWEQCKVGNMINEYVETTTINNQYPSLTSSRKGIFLQTDYFDGNQIASKNNIGYNIVPRGYFTYRHMSDDEIFHFNINNIVDFGIVSTLYPVFTTNETIDSKLLQYILNTGNEFRKFAILQKQGGSRTYMYLNKLKKLEITVPKDYKEQAMISEFFTKLDDNITLHQRKCEKLKMLKKSMLEKMFPKNGEKVPEVRFEGFTDDWEQCKLDDIANRFDNQRIPIAASRRIAGSTPYYGANGIQDYVKGFTHEGEFILIAEDGANDLKNYPIKCVNGRIWVNNHAHVLQGKLHIADNKFLAFSIGQNDIESLLVGGGRSKLNANTMMMIETKLPRLEEQVKIGFFFTKIDDLITLHQRKVEKLQMIKKSMLDKMFV